MLKKSTIRLQRNGKKFKLNGYAGKIPLYNYSIEVVFLNDKQIKEWSGQQATAWVFVNENNHSEGFLVWFGKESDRSIIAHECYHVTNYISKWCGLSDDNTNEQQAYLLQSLFKEIEKVAPKSIKV